jgi:replicative DNA helicase
MSVLGGVLLENEALNKALEILRPDDFYRDSHRKIFSALIELSNRGEPADLVTLTAALQQGGSLEAVGGGSTWPPSSTTYPPLPTYVLLQAGQGEGNRPAPDSRCHRDRHQGL